MKYVKYLLFPFLFFSLSSKMMSAQSESLTAEVKQTMLKATNYMVEMVSTHGGYNRIYLADLSRRWGELEAYKTQIQMTYGLTSNMGNTFLNAYEATGNKYYYKAAKEVAKAIIWGQLPCGGWDYIIDFAGDRSLKEWYKTIGKNAWGWDEYNHYYGVATLKNMTTTAAVQFLLRMYIENLDPIFKPALDKGINFILKSQYPLGGWPQRYPQKINRQYSFDPKDSVSKAKYFNGKLDYTSFYIFNDELTWDNIQFLIQCYIALGDECFLDPIMWGMNFYLITQ